MAKSAKFAGERRRRDLSLEEIVRVALGILGSEGEAALTMRRLADACGVTPMAIYHHVTDKAALLELAVNQVVLDALPGRTASPLPWREELVRTVSAFRNALVDNPGAGRVFVRQAVVGSGTAAVTEIMLRLLNEAGLTGDAVVEAADSLTLVVLGSVVNELTRPPAVRERLIGHLAESETPFLVQHLPAYAHRDPEKRFLRALGWLIDGFERDRDIGG